MNTSLASLDPEIRRFVKTICTESARQSAGQSPDWTQRRAIAERVRAPWRSGGPAMADTREWSLSSPAGPFRIRLYRPQSSEATPAALIYLHGGGWSLFSIDTHDRLMREYAHASGATVIGVDYALAPEHRYPVALHQVIAALRWLRGRAENLGIDGDRLALGGDSAGANLSLAAALQLRDAGEASSLRALLLNYGAYDSQMSAQARRELGGSDDMLSAEEMDQFWRNYVGENPADCNDPMARPLRASLHGLPPAFIALAERDLLAEQSLQLTLRLRQQGAQPELREYRGASHSFLEAMSISTLARTAIADGAIWLRQRLSPNAC